MDAAAAVTIGIAVGAMEMAGATETATGATAAITADEALHLVLRRFILFMDTILQEETPGHATSGKPVNKAYRAISFAS